LPLGDFLWVLRIKHNAEIEYEEPDEVAEINNPNLDQQDENEN
jgi:hypothetical protein